MPGSQAAGAHALADSAPGRNERSGGQDANGFSRSSATRGRRCVNEKPAVEVERLRAGEPPGETPAGQLQERDRETVSSSPFAATAMAEQTQDTNAEESQRAGFRDAPRQDDVRSANGHGRVTCD